MVANNRCQARVEVCAHCLQDEAGIEAAERPGGLIQSRFDDTAVLQDDETDDISACKGKASRWP